MPARNGGGARNPESAERLPSRQCAPVRAGLRVAPMPLRFCRSATGLSAWAQRAQIHFPSAPQCGQALPWPRRAKKLRLDFPIFQLNNQRQPGSAIRQVRARPAGSLILSPARSMPAPRANHRAWPMPRRRDFECACRAPSKIPAKWRAPTDAGCGPRHE